MVTVAAATIAVGVSYAAAAGASGGGRVASSGRIYACVTPRFQTFNLSTAGAACPNGERKISWNVAGPAGPHGARGARGVAGRDGKNGRPGATGSQGPAGTNGTNGSNGTTGATGPTGPAGTLASSYLDAYTSLPGTCTGCIADGAPYTFDTVQASSAIVASGTNNTTFTVSSAGEYLVTFVLFRTGQVSEPTQLEINGSSTGAGPTVYTGGGFPPASFTRILTLRAGDQITVVNTSGTSTNDVVGSGITIVRIA